MAFFVFGMDLAIRKVMVKYNGTEFKIMKTTRVLLTALPLVGALELSLLLLSSGTLHAETIRVAENLRGETVILPSSAPETDRFILVSFVTIGREAEVLAAMAVYDNPQTTRPVDYLEFYDGVGNLLQASWLDKFGIRRIAVDRGLLQEEASGFEGVLILILEGIPT